MKEPRDFARCISQFTIPDGTGDRFSGYAVIGLPFSSGHVLAHRGFAASRSYTVFVLELGGRLVFPQGKTYFPGPGKPDHHFDPQWSAATAQLFERAQTADQRKAAEASSLFQEIRKKESRLRAWAELALVRRQFESGDTSALVNLTSPSWSRVDGLTPNGLPVALLAAAHVEDVPAAQRPRFVPLLQATLDGLRAGRWLCSFEERRFYDGELRRLLELASARPGSIEVSSELARLQICSHLATLGTEAYPDKQENRP